MTSLLVSFLVSFFITIFIIRSQQFHGRFSSDLDLDGPQKFHKTAVPRIGGLGIAIGLTAAVFIHYKSPALNSQDLILLLCTAPVFVIGLIEDFTKKIGVRTRLIFTAIGAALVVYFLHTEITRLDIPGVDILLSISPIAMLFTVFAMTGLTNAYNIIDGFNGLSSMVGMITLLALGYVSITVGDPLITYLSFSMVAAILGFFIWNYPRGLIFLGDGGAYLIGFWIAALSVMIVARHDMISPWFALLINAYPIWETIFTIYRRKFHQGKNPGHPDGIHFHSLIFRRILNNSAIQTENDFFTANARTSPYLWVLTSLAVIPAVKWWESTPILIGCFIIFASFYVWLYTKIVKFQTPEWMHNR
ncbi:UDP-N-acetylmuramyl pentapeptide phosphotransferase/UDP-N-acetylglucosamine-1-phosphate transferase [Polynucleobacter meluiroseus]|uniref:UDP-N-acetylmuramyl pentapeptide phosphotransferase/UDP-N-acetylglucosamine-1-phosphate transferase n=1 Tax=Polynucleobacter meluiroseus TaxID=1938814 RepID=A0A240E353_9BURK|nr:glycosyltransferase [Polynucleobacter meluiroseus]SNX29622.1 UDP-N-acetylmuramyl pentapeptide phosphotransferase/UDP-N-acetylglucosamine-1-phosphate transferase [Polynucleobacter meluiroseus]